MLTEATLQQPVVSAHDRPLARRAQPISTVAAARYDSKASNVYPYACFNRQLCLRCMYVRDAALRARIG